MDDSSIDERQTFQTPNIGQEAPTANFQEQINPIQDTTNKPLIPLPNKLMQASHKHKQHFLMRLGRSPKRNLKQTSS
ncbi:hypothetical protein ACXOXN_03220 [Streptococcus thermophilus]|uniref:hypothetical protein n=1 Tax=Streptococcus thermophilus TaxID=1308 RepID=UPI0015D8271E|nr:hypothetical protein [Streptococcus thermophilus]MBZ5771110.1 hypothetical protein [Streptococcus thermophilus]MBZ5813293.1 hypothetical protein [Streptococcus thermophilus]MCE2213254.1 hypothetical protein [Streptococcus thermophilus]MCE2214782.1 hypothetical protein [Streptococcus thermophilus]MCE2296719.1 hypothetical protein [Streptococcus thermophilus]